MFQIDLYLSVLSAHWLSLLRILQAAGRRVAYHTFAHVLDLDISFHLERRTGALSRVLERGTRSIAVMFRAIVFTFIPTIVELVSPFMELTRHRGLACRACSALISSVLRHTIHAGGRESSERGSQGGALVVQGLVAVLLARSFNPMVAALVVVTFGAYVAWTMLMTAVRLALQGYMPNFYFSHREYIEVASRCQTEASRRFVEALRVAAGRHRHQEGSECS